MPVNRQHHHQVHRIANNTRDATDIVELNQQIRQLASFLSHLGDSINELEDLISEVNDKLKQ